jgi:hypothetical protein
VSDTFSCIENVTAPAFEPQAHQPLAEFLSLGSEKEEEQMDRQTGILPKNLVLSRFE